MTSLDSPKAGGDQNTHVTPAIPDSVIGVNSEEVQVVSDFSKKNKSKSKTKIRKQITEIEAQS